MSDSTPNCCPNCGAELGPDAPESLCPRCLMQNADWTETQAFPDDDANSAPTISSEQSSALEVLSEGAHFGDYRIVKLLGRGGMGAVYEAEQLENGRRIALKVLSHELDSDDARKRFIREGRLAASINHPNSVYVFGTEEIEGTPTISMEIVPGGTLQEQVMRDGPMPIPGAIDAILQIMRGLESAQAIGILHRDVKPSNCFIDEQGVAKIGDFGLSISTDARGDSHLTMHGALLGTPAFSSPEQLRGDELNARSDMYSVGATLFYLLTGHSPFEEKNMVKLLSRVLEEPPPDPRLRRPEIPKALARIILRCLEKTPADRYKSYADLAKLLQPYSSESSTPATLALRFGAYMIDSVVVGTVGFFIQAAAWGNFGDMFNQENFSDPKYVVIVLGLNLLTALYFGILEGARGASVGKNLLRLRLVGPDGNTPGFLRAFLRACLVLAIIAGPYWMVTLVKPDWMTAANSSLTSALIGVSNFITLGILFCVARRRNGYAGLHGLATGTRVMRAPRSARRPRLTLDDVSSIAPLKGTEHIGPYAVIESLTESKGDQWFLGYDTKLLRRVWIHVVSPGTPAVSSVQRNLHRVGRLRWITGRRSETDNWDTYEALDGKPLTALVGEPQNWAAVRFWLHDLANELVAAEADGTTPATLAFDRVWITADGHAKLLNFPCPGAKPSPDRIDDPATFIRAIGTSMITSAAPPVPLHATPVLGPDKPAKLESLCSDLRNSIRRPAQISRRRRTGITLAVSAFPLIGLCFGLLFVALNNTMQKNNPELATLSSVTLAIQLSKSDAEREHLRRYVAHHFRDLVDDPATWRRWESNVFIDPRRQRIAKEAVEEFQSLTPSDIAAAESVAKPIMANLPGLGPNFPPFVPLVIFLTLWIAYAAIPSLVMALLLRRGVILMMFGATVVTGNGKQASRFRAFWRCLIAWSPFLLGIFAMTLIPLVGAIPTTAIAVVSILLLSIYSNLRTDRSLQDRLAGTWLVPK